MCDKQDETFLLYDNLVYWISKFKALIKTRRSEFSGNLIDYSQPTEIMIFLLTVSMFTGFMFSSLVTDRIVLLISGSLHFPFLNFEFTKKMKTVFFNFWQCFYVFKACIWCIYIPCKVSLSYLPISIVWEFFSLKLFSMFVNSHPLD